MASRHGVADYPIEIRHFDVDEQDGRTIVDVGIIVDVPGRCTDQNVAPTQMFPADVRRNDLLDALQPIIGSDAIIVSRIELRYASKWGVGTREELQLSEPVTEEDSESQRQQSKKLSWRR